MAQKDMCTEARDEIGQLHEVLLKSIDSFGNEVAVKSSEIVSSVDEQQEYFKKEINSLNEVIASSQTKLSTLTEGYMIQQQDCTQKEAEVNEIKDEIFELSNTKEITLPTKLSKLESNNKVKLQSLREKKQKLKALLARNGSKIKQLVAHCRAFEKNLGMICYVVLGTENLRISFTQITRLEPDREFFVTVTFKEDQYRIIECSTKEDSKEVLRYLEHQLNSNKVSLSQFVKLVRTYFVLIAEKEAKEITI